MSKIRKYEFIILESGLRSTFKIDIKSEYCIMQELKKYTYFCVYYWSLIDMILCLQYIANGHKDTFKFG